LKAQRDGKVQLSARQAIILRILMEEGETSKVIADRLHLSCNTVDNYVAELLSFLRLDSRLKLIVWGHQHPSAVDGVWCDPDLHPPNCKCSGAFCSLAA
jgi:DNA-binding NarL/FixJ family response regulator